MQILHRRGLEKDLPVLAEGEIVLTTDSKKLFFGTSSGNIEVTNASDLEKVSTQVSEFYGQFSTIREAVIAIDSIVPNIVDNISVNNLAIERLEEAEHNHTNDSVLNQLEDADGNLSYRGQALGAVYYTSVETLADRDDIPMSQRNEGLMVLVRQEGSSYYLKGGTDNAFWTIFATGAGGATNAATLSVNPSGDLTASNVQSAIDELESTKVSFKDAYSKAEIDNKLELIEIDYSTLTNLPDLSSLHSHENAETLRGFSQYRGELTWNSKTFGNMISEIYDKDKDGIIDSAATLTGLQASVNELNFTKGLSGNIQAQINAITTGAVFRGEFASYNALIQNHTAEKSDWVFVISDETKSGARTQYYYDGDNWVYGGGATVTPMATSEAGGTIKLAGDLENPEGTADSPQLSITGVTEGLYKNPILLIDNKGRVLQAEEGDGVAVNDGIVSEVETWSSQKIYDSLFAKANKDHTHTQLHNANMIGEVEVDMSTKQDKYVVTYNAQKSKAEWVKSQGGKVLVGSKYIEGDYTLVAGSYINLFIDETAKTVTINSTFRDGVANGVPTLTEITDTVLVPGGSSVRVTKPASFNKYMVNVVKATNSENNVIDISVYEKSDGGSYEYLSNKNQSVHDLLSLPIADLDNSKSIHLGFTNYGTTDTYVSYKIKTTNLV